MNLEDLVFDIMRYFVGFLFVCMTIVFSGLIYTVLFDNVSLDTKFSVVFLSLMGFWISFFGTMKCVFYYKINRNAR